MKLFNEPVRWKVSRAWSSKHIDCTLKGILKGCNGICCNNKTFYPAKSNGGTCYYLGNKGCVLEPKDKPIKCLLYPLVLKNESIVLYGRALTWTCKPNYKLGEVSILENLKGNLCELFGIEQYNRVYNDVIVEGKNSYFEPSEVLLKQLEQEEELEEKNEIPIKRSTNQTN